METGEKWQIDLKEVKSRPHSLGQSVEWKLAVGAAIAVEVNSSRPHSLGQSVEWKLGVRPSLNLNVILMWAPLAGAIS